jgi:Right handed beta helix region
MRGFLLAGLVLLATDAKAVDYFVSTNGSDSNLGTSSNAPWLTLGRINQSRFFPGDAIHFHGGQTFGGTLFLKNSGITTNPIVIDSYGTGPATLSALSNQDAINATNQGGFWIRNLSLTNSDPNSTNGCGINLYATNPKGIHFPGVLIQNVEVAGFGDTGIKAGGAWIAKNPGWDFLWVSHVHSHDNGEGMRTYGYTEARYKPEKYAFGSISVLDSEFDHNNSSGLELCGAGKGVVERSCFHENFSIGGCWTWGARNIVIQHCISWGNQRSDSTDGFGFDLDGGSQECIVQSCLSYENDTVGFAIYDYPESADTKNNTIRYCISENDVRLDQEWGSFEMEPYADTPIMGCNIVNCVAYLTTRGGTNPVSGFEAYGRDLGFGAPWYTGGISSCSFRNNVIYLDGPGHDLRLFTCNTGSISPNQVNLQGNLYYSSSGNTPVSFDGNIFPSFSKWAGFYPKQEHLGKSSTARLVNPLFLSVGSAYLVNDTALMDTMPCYRPGYWSPCLGGGLNLKRLFHLDPGYQDFWEIPLSLYGVSNIGAY